MSILTTATICVLVRGHSTLFDLEIINRCRIRFALPDLLFRTDAKRFRGTGWVVFVLCVSLHVNVYESEY
jgi:hypothetical protein